MSGLLNHGWKNFTQHIQLVMFMNEFFVNNVTQSNYFTKVLDRFNCGLFAKQPKASLKALFKRVLLLLTFYLRVSLRITTLTIFAIRMLFNVYVPLLVECLFVSG